MPSPAQAAAARALAGWRLADRPPTMREFSRRVRYPGGPLAGHAIDIDSDPVHAYVVDQIDSGRWDSLAWCASPQVSGKTLIGILLFSLHGAIGLRLPTGYALPTLQDLDKAWESKIKRQMVDSGFERALPTKGPGARGGRGPTVQLHDPDSGKRAAQLIFMAGGAYGDTAARLAVDEVDQFRKADGTPDWQAIMDLISRTKSYGSKRMTSFVGTIETNEPDKCLILQLAETQGSGTRPWLRCPECGRHQIVTGDNFTYQTDDEMTVRETARIGCQHCPSRWDGPMLYAAQRKMMMCHKGQVVDDHGKIIGPEPRTTRLGIIENAFAASIVDLPTVAVERWQAHALEALGDKGAIRKYHWYTECQCRVEQDDETGMTTIPTRSRLAALSAASDMALDTTQMMDDGTRYTWQHIPEWAEFVTVACDVQRGGDRAAPRIYGVAYARGGAKGALVGHFTLTVCAEGRQATTQELHAALDRVEQLLADWSPATPIIGKGIDIGDQTDELIKWLRSRKTWCALKGTAPIKAHPTDRPGWIYPRQQHDSGYLLRLVETQSVLRVIHGEILARDGDGALKLPRGLEVNSAVVTHICASVEYEPGKWSKAPKDRKYHPEWQRRNDYADCLCYARAMAYEWQTRPQKRHYRRKYGAVGKI